MRTTDFSQAPPQAQAEAMVVVEEYDAPRSRQRAAKRNAQRSSGHCWSTTFRSSNQDGHAVRGVIAYFRTRVEAETFLTSRELDPAQRGRVFHAEEQGYSNGVWRAEGNTMAHIVRFSPVSREVERGSMPPRVDESGSPRQRRSWRRRQAASGGVGRASAAKHRSPAAAGAMFIGATRYRGVHSWLILSRDWYPMVAKMRRMSGYVWHTVYWEAPFTLGTLAFFTTRDDLLVFARLREHRRLMQWITQGTTHGTGGYIRLYVADPSPEPERAT